MSDATHGDANHGGANADVATLGYEQARDELVDLVARLESGRVGLEESMTLWERGEALATHCTTWLDRAEARLGEEVETAKDPGGMRVDG